MKILCISDTHGCHHNLDLSEYEADVLVHSGDWTRGRDLALSETKDFMQWLSEQPFKYKICIAGNHEREVEASHNRAFIPKDVIYLENSEVTLDGIKFYGSPYSNRFGAWAFMDDEMQLSKIWAMIPEDTDVLITHGPAYGHNDLVVNSYGDDPHVGSTSLRNRKFTLKDTLKLHISGHIHEAYGITKDFSITNVCSSILNERYLLVNVPILIEI